MNIAFLLEGQAGQIVDQYIISMILGFGVLNSIKICSQIALILSGNFIYGYLWINLWILSHYMDIYG